MASVALVFTVAGLIISVGFLANVIFKKVGFPDILFLILMGVIFGPILGLFSTEDLLPVIPVFAALSLMLILFQGGLSMEVHIVLSQSIRATALAFLYAIFATVFVSVFGHFVLEFDWVEALILGPMTAGTSSVVIIPLMSKLKVPEEVKATLSLESTVTDVFNIVLTMIFLQVYLGGTVSLQEATSSLIAKFAIGVMLGAIGGITWIKVLEIVRKQEYTYMLTIAALVLCYAGTEFLGGSGPLSALVFGMALGNYERMRTLGLNIDAASMPTIIEKIRDFHDEISFLVKALFFMILGLIYTLNTLGLTYAGIVMAVNLMLRYLAIEIATRNTPLYKYRRFMTLMCGTGLANATLSLIVHNELMMRQIPIAGLYPLIVTNIIMMNNAITALAPLLLRKD
ncbi:cation:proton antiporter [Candidatus Bathyarchaeota archaeon]|nr:cation:proton antiporter [Candidatus Bathyarchaeota archaeon]